MCALLLQASSIRGKFVRKIGLQQSEYDSYGLAISRDKAHMAVSHSNHTLSVYSLPGGKSIKTFGREGSGKGQFDGPQKLCFTVAGNILVAEFINQRVQEVTLTGEHVRFIGAGKIFGLIYSIATNGEVIAVAISNSSNRVMMFDAVTGAFLRAFGNYGGAAGQWMGYCNGIRFTPDNRHVIVAESGGFGAGKGRLSVFTLGGEFVKRIGEDFLRDAADLDFADNCDIIVCDASRRVCVYSADGSSLLRQWIGERSDAVASGVGLEMDLCALAMCNGQLFVLDSANSDVYVFE